MIAILLHKPEVSSIFSAVIENSGVMDVSDELRDNLLKTVLNLYLRVRSFSKAKDIKVNSMEKQTKTNTRKKKQEHPKSGTQNSKAPKSKGLRKLIKQKSSKEQ